MNLNSLLLSAYFVTISSACIAHEQYRTDYDLCASAKPDEACATSALHQHVEEGDAEEDFFLGFIEFDDQGALWDRAQAQAVIDHLLIDSSQNDLLLVVFVHGWKHSAAAGDANIALFRKNLALLSKIEGQICEGTSIPRRKVAGVYLGWRGGSVSAPILKQLTFWDRKNTAHKVGHGGVSEVLGRLEGVRDIRRTMADSSRARLIIIGHSFGGAVVYSALSQILEERFVLTEAGPSASGAARGFGDLVVLINPAFEAQRYSELSDMSAERYPYPPNQLPVLAILTSEADSATGTAFPIGRSFSTVFEKERKAQRPNGFRRKTETIDQSQANVRAVGHFRPYRTHSLAYDDSMTINEETAYQSFFDVSTAWEEDRPGGEIRFPGSVLKRRDTTGARNPYLVIRVSDKIIPNHNDIDRPRVVMFLSQLIMLSSQADDPKLRAELRSRAR